MEFLDSTYFQEPAQALSKALAGATSKDLADFAEYTALLDRTSELSEKLKLNRSEQEGLVRNKESGWKEKFEAKLSEEQEIQSQLDGLKVQMEEKSGLAKIVETAAKQLDKRDSSMCGCGGNSLRIRKVQTRAFYRPSEPLDSWRVVYRFELRGDALKGESGLSIKGGNPHLRPLSSRCFHPDAQPRQ